MIGVGYRRELAAWIGTQPVDLGCLEITAEHFYGKGEPLLAQLQKNFPLFLHSLGLSLGTPGPLERGRLERFADLVRLADPQWISEHVAFTHAGEVDLGHLNPLRPTRDSAQVVAEHAQEIRERCGKPLLLENITSHLRLRGELSEPEFLNLVCDQAGCGLLLDVTNLYINSRNHAFDPLVWVQALDPARIWQLHIVGYSQHNGHWTDGHAEPIQPELLDLAQAIAAYAPVQAVILERDTNFPGTEAMAHELAKLKRIFGAD